MTEKDTVGLTSKVIKATDEGKLHWEKTTVDNTFTTTLGSYKLHLLKTPRGNFYLKASDSNGIELFSIGSYSNYEIERMWEKVRRTVFKIDEGISEIDDLLDKL